MTRDKRKTLEGTKKRGRRGPRLLPLVAAVAAIAVVALAAGQLYAGDPAWKNIPQYVPPHAKYRGPGNYLSLIKLLTCWGLFALWVATTDWVSVDSQKLKLDYQRWNAIVFGVFLGAFILAWLLPMFAVAYPVLVLAYIVPLTLYILHRNAQVTNNRRVLTPEHLRFLIATMANKFGAKVPVERKDPMEAGPPVKLLGRSGVDAVTDNARVGLARQTAGFLPARELLAEALGNRAEALMLDFTQESAAVHTMVDGVWIAREARGRDVCDPALETFKVLCGLNAQDRQNRQEGKFAAEFGGKKHAASFMSQGTPTGERMVVQFEEATIPRRSLEELGIRTKLQEQISEQIAKPRGVLLFSAGPSCGLRSTVDAVLHTTDRFVREFAAFENVTNPYQYVENIPVTTFDPAGEETLPDALHKFFRKEPSAAVIRDLADGPMVDLLCEATTRDRVVFTTMRAGDCAEALLRVLALGANAETFAEAVTLVVNQRLVRKLCDKCKEAYTPTPQMLQQLGIPQGRVQAFYRPPTPNPQEPKEPCSQCGGIGYFGRTGLFEVLVVGDTVRKVLTTKPRLDLLRQAARRDGMKSFQEEGIFLVAKGVTSLPELMRVLK